MARTPIHPGEILGEWLNDLEDAGEELDRITPLQRPVAAKAPAIL